MDGEKIDKKNTEALSDLTRAPGTFWEWDGALFFSLPWALGTVCRCHCTAGLEKTSVQIQPGSSSILTMHKMVGNHFQK